MNHLEYFIILYNKYVHVYIIYINTLALIYLCTIYFITVKHQAKYHIVQLEIFDVFEFLHS